MAGCAFIKAHLMESLMTIDLVFITYNRLEYTKLALASVLAEPTEEFSLTIWDNASTDGTVEYLKDEVNDQRIADIVFSKENVGQVTAVNEVWGRSEADLLGKLDNDCLVTPGWTRTLAQAHNDIPKLGVIACWHYFPDDFDYERAKHKIQTFNGHQILRHPWTCGTGLLIKRDTFEKLGPIQGKTPWEYWLKMAMAGYINGFYYPLVYQEHMDDPRSKHSHLKDEASYQAAKKVTVTINSPGLETLADRWRRRGEILDHLLDNPWDVKYYVGWRGKWRRAKIKLARLFGGGKPQV
jgi:glycosyltransferase involved in cell wall biosynthesis